MNVSTLLILILHLARFLQLYSTAIKVFYFTIDYWRPRVEGFQNCGSDLTCDWTSADNLKSLHNKHINFTNQINQENEVTISVYNIHSWWERQKQHGPAICDLPTQLTLAESEESKVRYHALFDPTFKHFDGFSTTHPSSNIQRVYDSVFLNNSQFINNEKMHNFSTLIKAATYVAGDCHKRDNANSNRDNIVHQIRKAGFRVEGLGKCMHTINPEGISLPTNPEARYDMPIKRQAIARFMFNMAFENSIEDGYVTEKPFDALISGIFMCTCLHKNV